MQRDVKQRTHQRVMRACSVRWWLPRAMSPAQLQSRQPHMVSLMGSATPLWSSRSVRRCTMTSMAPERKEAPPCARSVTRASCSPSSPCAMGSMCQGWHISFPGCSTL